MTVTSSAYPAFKDQVYGSDAIVVNVTMDTTITWTTDLSLWKLAMAFSGSANAQGVGAVEGGGEVGQ